MTFKMVDLNSEYLSSGDDDEADIKNPSDAAQLTTKQELVKILPVLRSVKKKPKPPPHNDITTTPKRPKILPVKRPLSENTTTQQQKKRSISASEYESDVDTDPESKAPKMKKLTKSVQSSDAEMKPNYSKTIQLIDRMHIHRDAKRYQEGLESFGIHSNIMYGHDPKWIFSTFKDRLDLSKNSEIMKQVQTSIQSTGGEPTNAVALMGTGGYRDDDYGEIIIFSGQSDNAMSDQTLKNAANRALFNNFRKKVPIRVVRNHKLNSHYAPLVGVVYDGLYYVTGYWQERLNGGPLEYRFRLARAFGQLPVPVRRTMLEPEPTDEELLATRALYDIKSKAKKKN
jgi:hypothetical protein